MKPLKPMTDEKIFDTAKALAGEGASVQKVADTFTRVKREVENSKRIAEIFHEKYPDTADGALRCLLDNTDLPSSKIVEWSASPEPNTPYCWIVLLKMEDGEIRVFMVWLKTPLGPETEALDDFSPDDSSFDPGNPNLDWRKM